MTKARLVAAATFLAAASIAITPFCAQSQTPAGGDQPLAFEVASVREDRAGGDSSSNFALDGNGNVYWVMSESNKTAQEGSLFRATNQTLLRYIIFAYNLDGTEELALRAKFWAGLGVDVPSWVANTHYDIEARASGTATKDQMRLMMQTLLAERFKLIVHKETREAPVFALELDKVGTLGPQLHTHPASEGCTTTVYPNAAEKSGAGTGTSQTLPIPCGMIARLPPRAPEWHKIGGRNVTLAMVAASLPAQTGLVTFPRPVVDQTGLSGTFDFSLEWTQVADSDVAVGPNAQSEAPGPPMAKALKQQLGLKLESTKGPVELLVIDRVEKPSEN